MACKTETHEQRHELEQRALLIWLEERGKTLQWLLAEIAEKQPGDKVTDCLGIGSKLPNPIRDESRMNGDWRILAARGLQYFICNRSWQRQPAQPDLFG